MTDTLKKQIAVAAAEIIYANEGNYASVNADDNGALSVGKVQWHGNRALSLLKTIIQTIGQASVNILNFALYREIQDSQNWSTRVMTVSEKVALSKLLDTPQGRAAQDDLAQKDIQSYVEHGVNLGIEDPQSLVYYADLENQGGAGASKRIGLAAIKTAGSASKVTLDAIHKEALSDRVMSEYAARRNKVFSKAQLLFTNTVTESIAAVTEADLRNKIIQIAKSYLGAKEADGSHRPIIDLYNRHNPLARGYKVKYTDSWCATFVSVVAIVAKMTAIIPTECGCGQMINLLKKINEWQENDAYTPKPGDIIFYDWNDTGKGDTSGWPEHVGIVVSVSGGTIKVIEGNISNAVGYRSVAVNAKNIRGYGLPNYVAMATQTASDNPVNPPAKSANPYKEPAALLKYVKADVSKVRDTVKWLQWELEEAGYALDIDGKFGTKTKSAVEAFQKSNNLSVDGICGSLTRKALKASN
jgi:hypothetical protein